MMRAFCLSLVIAVLFIASASRADQGYPYPGMVVTTTAKSFAILTRDLTAAIAANEMGLVTQASASAGAASRGIKIAGNMVFGVYRNDFAVRMLAASVPAGIEAPVRFYVTENPDGSATLTYRRPSAVFAPYGNADLDTMAAELDVIFGRIAEGALEE